VAVWARLVVVERQVKWRPTILFPFGVDDVEAVSVVQ
jgi:hypothetical protein